MNLRDTKVLYTHGGGRFGNQMLRFLHWLAWVHDQRERRKVVDMAFWPYSDLFTHWARHPGCSFPLPSRISDVFARSRRFLPERFREGFDWRLRRLAFSLGRRLKWFGVSAIDLPDDGYIVLDSAGCAQPAVGPGWVVCGGWRITAWSLVERHAAVLRALFEPEKQYKRKATSFLGRLRLHHDIVVGLLIRQGDYREWRGGRYFYPTDSYLRWITEIPDLFPGRRVAIVVASEEWLDEVAFASPGVELASGSINRGGHWFESFLELSGCDVVVSAPSTFSACAAFLGNKPILPLRSATQILNAADLLQDHLISAATDEDFSRSVR